MMDDDRFDDFLDSAAPEYHRPPADVPREAMWERIQATRQRTAGDPARWGRTHRTAVAGARSRLTITQWSVGLAAAALLLASGVVIGRWSRPGAVAPTVAVAPPASDTTAPTRNAMPMAYRLTVIDHLNRTEALLTTFRSDVRAGRATDAQVATWARGLLTTTRLLADSPAGSDPKMKRLLEDLELVLAQMAQLDPATHRVDLDLIQHAMDERSVMPRLRAATPVMPYTSGT